jgi:hypothetical protein
MITFDLTATVPATMNVHGEPIGSFTARYRISAPGPDAADCVAHQLLAADMARARVVALGSPEITMADAVTV